MTRAVVVFVVAVAVALCIAVVHTNNTPAGPVIVPTVAEPGQF